MVTEGKLFSSPRARYRLGSVLIWLGVLAWTPYIFLRVTGISTSPFWFLPIHLVGVIGGSRLRSSARAELGLHRVKRDPWRILGHGSIWLGVGVWIPYFYLKLILGAAVNVMDFLPYHLTGVLGGVLLLIIGSFVSRREIPQSETGADNR